MELHRHLEGSLRLATLVEVARSHGLSIINTGQLRGLVQVNEAEPYTYSNFLSKFETLRLFYRSPEIIGRLAREAIADAAADNVRYMELRFTPVALSKSQDFSLAEVMDWVIEGTQQACQENDIVVRLIASLNRHEAVELGERVIQLAVDRMSQGIVGLDLAGNETNYSALPFTGIFAEAKKAGLRLTIHAGEWSGAGNVAEAIVNLKADRIGHGVRVMEDPMAVSLANDVNIPFEVCITSNYQSGVVPALKVHPLAQMLTAGLNVTVNTDDPSISQITLSNEYRLACEELGFSLSVLKERVLSAARAAFLTVEERQALEQKLNAEFERYIPGQKL